LGGESHRRTSFVQDPNPTEAPPLRARLLGRVEIVVGEREIPDQFWSGRLPRALLLLLLGTPGHRLPRDRVLDLLWPEARPEAALNALYKTVHAVRRVLEPDLTTGRASSYLAIQGETVGLTSVPGTWVDADVFEAELARVGAVPVAERGTALRRALDLYTGDFLEEEPYADWPVARREALRQAHERAALALAALDLEAGNPLASVPRLQGLLLRDPVLEEAHRALMIAYAAAGQRERALRQFARCRAVLETELGVAPAAETVALRESIESVPVVGSTVAQVPVLARPLPLFNLPAPPSPLVGRDAEVDEIQVLLLRQDVRLVTLTGAGGIGKTRLALEVAAGLTEDFAGGVAFVSLASLADPALVVPTIARTLEIREERGRPVEAALQAALAERELLLVLDNFEHLLPAAPAVAEVLAACGQLKVLATSREALRLRFEHERVLRPLGVPNLDRLPASHALPRYGAVALFQQAIATRRPDFAITPANARAVAEICVRLDGLPLAIELAAARCRRMAPERLVADLARPLIVLTGGPRDLPARQQTLRDAIAWSYDLLTGEERALFRRLGVFAGGCTLGAVEAVCGGSAIEEGIGSLADKSLIDWDEAEEKPRVRMLETIREFALERLAVEGDADAAATAHAAYFLDLAERVGPALDGAGQIEALATLEMERDNLRLALVRSIAGPEPEAALRLVGALWRFWRVRGYLAEGRAWAEQALALARDSDATFEVLLGLSKLATAQGDLSDGTRYAEEALGVARRRGDGKTTGAALGGLAALAVYQGRLDEASVLNEKAIALCQAAGYEWGIADNLNRQGLIAYLRNDQATARPLLEESVALFRQVGDRRVAAIVLGNLGVMVAGQNDLARAIEHYEESLAINREMGDRGQSILILANLGDAVRRMGDNARGAELALESLRLAREVGDKRSTAVALYSLGVVRQEGGDERSAIQHLMESLALNRDIGDRVMIAWCLERLAGVATSAHRTELGARLLGAAGRMREENGSPVQPSEESTLAAVETALRTTLGDEAFAANRAIGSSMTIEEAVEAVADLAALVLTA
jgi:predicted ATPase/DNA-binding SARP family transcriptional activator